ncbi:hypothetical protein BSZ35_04665 [Salinibacter sp. 10B]|nr:hypothetical protein BSZ35_04665 [Salinibacter sp. 10B]
MSENNSGAESEQCNFDMPDISPNCPLSSFRKNRTEPVLSSDDCPDLASFLFWPPGTSLFHA